SAAALSVAAASGGRVKGYQAWSLLWRASRGLSILVVVWALVGALVPPLVVAALGLVVGRIPGAVVHGIGSPAGHGLILALVLAALVYGLSLVLDPVGNALSTACDALVTGDIQGRLLRAVSEPVGIAHLEDPEVLDRLARAEGSLTGFFPGSAPVTWVSGLASRASGLIACLVVAYYQWWLGLGLLLLWLVVRRLMLAAVVRQATELRNQTTTMRHAWYFIGLGSRARDAKEIRVFGLADFVAGRYQDTYRAALHGGAAGLRQVHTRALACWLLVAAGLAGTVGEIAEAARTHEIGLRSLAILLPMLAVTMAVGNVSLDDITLAWTLAGLPDAQRLETELTAGHASLGGAERAAGPKTSVRFEGVRFRYPNGAKDVLAGVDLDLPVGTSTAIVGVNGAGKSTLVSLLSRLRDPSSGAVTVDGVDLRDVDARTWQRAVAIMPQEPVRYPFSAYDNIALGAIEHRDDRAGVEAVADLAGFTEVLERMPHGWETVLNRELPGGTELSGGQWQRLALARALFATRHGARLLVLDEPTAALDVRSEAAFYGRFLEITGGLTTVVISHRFAIVRRADRIAVL
ncbi:MAG: ATP-binding cassette domain-containing protein, partial [Actinobacteria bacterium]|nr:ATP-binding cassette domain-containing protein [Actinomycetota bacterium]